MKKWYQSKTIWIQILQIVQLLAGLVASSIFPNMSPTIVTVMTVVGAILGKVQVVIRTLPSHGTSITQNQNTTRINNPNANDEPLR